MIINHQTMNIKIKILFTILTLSTFYGCSVEENMMDTPYTTATEQGEAQVVLSISVPEVSLPSGDTRAITDDTAIGNLAIWAFDYNNEFIYELTSESRDDKGNPKIIKRGNKIYAQLPESDTEITLALIGNYQTIETPTIGTSMQEAEKNLKFTFSENLNGIPMYGKSTPFIVKEGAKAGTISLKRALAKIEIDASNAWPNFELKAVSVINVNTAGTFAQSGTIINTATRRDDRIEVYNSADNASGNNNKWVYYIPEATDIKEGTRISLILEGINKKDNDGKTRFYRLDFIKREQSAGEDIKYDYITSIERNKRYAFKIEHIVAGTGSTSFEEAKNKERADNAIIKTQLMVIDNEEIRDITTDNEYYLGITSPELKASMKEDGDQQYYTVNMNVITNNPNGWQIDDLPTGVSVTVDKYNGGQEISTSVWIYIDKDTYKGANPLTIYVYSGNIRKSVHITILK